MTERDKFVKLSRNNKKRGTAIKPGGSFMNVFVVNCGSSSLKYQLIDAQSEVVLAKGLCERIGIEGSQIVYKPARAKEAAIRL